MKNIKIILLTLVIAVLLSVSSSVNAANQDRTSIQSPESSSAKSLPSLDTRANDCGTRNSDCGLPEPEPTPPASSTDQELIRACAEAVAELRSARNALTAKDIAYDRQGELLQLEKELRELYQKRHSLSETERGQLREALAAKDRQIAHTDAALQLAKKNQTTVWKTVKAVTFGVAAGIMVGVVMK